MASTLPDRFRALPASPFADALRLRAGSLRDYAALAEHHYKAKRPATATRVLTLACDQPDVAGRFLRLAGADPPEPDRSRCERVVGVLVESMPALQCRLREAALDGRYASVCDEKARAALLNEEVRCISRVVVHPQWRGLGLAVRLTREAVNSATTVYTEALAAMGRVHPFFEKAGMTAYRRPAHEFDARLTAAMHAVGLDPVDLASSARLSRRVDELPDPKRDWLLGELHRWYRVVFGRARKRSADPGDHWRAARSRLLTEPVYYVHANRAPEPNDGRSTRPT